MIGRIASVGLHVADAERSLRLYRDVLGLAVRLDSGWLREPSALLAATGAAGAAIRVVVLATADGGAAITLVQLDGIARAPVAGAFQDPGTAHVTFETDDLDADLARIEAAGYRPLARPATIAGVGARTSRIVFVADDDGFLVELLERPDDTTRAEEPA